MTLDIVDAVWSAMGEHEFYSPGDLANSLGRPTHAVTRVLEFLTEYGFAERVTKREMIFRRLANALAPGDAVRALQTLLGDMDVDSLTRVASVPETSDASDYSNDATNKW